MNIWDVASGQLRKSFKGPGSVVLQAIAVSPDGSQIASAAYDGHASIIDTATGAEVYSFRVWSGRAKASLAYSPDGGLLASTGEVRTQIDLWNMRTHQRSTRLTGHTGVVHSVSFSRDGRLLASCGLDRTVRVWDVAGARCTAVLSGHTGELFSAAFHPDGTRLASGGRDRAVWLWDLTTGKEVARLEGHANYIFTLAFSPDGASLVSGSGDNTVRIWDTEPTARRRQARREAENLRPRPSAWSSDSSVRRRKRPMSLRHCGRISHSALPSGKRPCAPSCDDPRRGRKWAIADSPCCPPHQGTGTRGHQCGHRERQNFQIEASPEHDRQNLPGQDRDAGRVCPGSSW